MNAGGAQFGSTSFTFLLSRILAALVFGAQLCSARAGSADTREFKPGTLPPREQAQAILNAYLEALKFSNGRVNGSYLSSLGLVAP